MCITKGLNFSHKQVESVTYIVYFHSGINDFITSRASKDDIAISEQILSSYKKEEKIIDEQPNIVIIMCEALTDYYIYKDFAWYQWREYYHLRSTTVRGNRTLYYMQDTGNGITQASYDSTRSFLPGFALRKN
jgi:hypothetical protein